MTEFLKNVIIKARISTLIFEERSEIYFWPFCVPEIKKEVLSLKKKADYEFAIKLIPLYLVAAVLTVIIVFNGGKKAGIKQYEESCKKVTYTYVVQEGDSLYNICKSHNPSGYLSTTEYMWKISDLNDFARNWNDIRPGEIIKLYYLERR